MKKKILLIIMGLTGMAHAVIEPAVIGEISLDCEGKRQGNAQARILISPSSFNRMAASLEQQIPVQLLQGMEQVHMRLLQIIGRPLEGNVVPVAEEEQRIAAA